MFGQAIQASEAMRQAERLGAGKLLPALSGLERACGRSSPSVGICAMRSKPPSHPRLRAPSAVPSGSRPPGSPPMRFCGSSPGGPLGARSWCA
jgi:hypothetical protein